MAQKTRSRFFSVMVIGDNPEEILSKYDVSKKSELHIKYKYLDAKKIQTTSLKLLSGILDEPKKIGLNEFQLNYLRERYNSIKALSPFEYYMLITQGMYYDEDGNAMTDENPDGKWVTAKIGSHFSLPLKLHDGTETYQSKSEYIDWDSMKGDETLYNVAWELVMEGRKPKTEDEKRVHEAMKDKVPYFKKFINKERYVKYSTSFWCYAVVDSNGWVDLDSQKDDIDWVTTFTEKFGKTIPDGELVTIYECTRNDDDNVSDDV